MPVLQQWSSVSGQVRGMFLIGFAALAFSSMHVLIRFLSADYHPFELAFFRNFFGLLALTPVLIRNGLGPLRTKRPLLHVARSLLQLASMLLFFSALTMEPLAKVSALSFTAPLFATFGAVVVLREPIHRRRVVALLVGFAGAMVIAHPGADVSLGALFVVISSMTWAIALLVIKVLARADSSVTLALYMGLLMAPMSLLPALSVWTWPEPIDYLWLLLLGLCGTAGHLAIGFAFQAGDATAILPVDFTRLLWASLFGFALFGEIPTLATWVGGLLIFGSATYIAIREVRAQALNQRSRPS